MRQAPAYRIFHEADQAKVKVQKPTRFAEGLQPGTFKHELNQRRIRAGQSGEDRQWPKL